MSVTQRSIRQAALSQDKELNADFKSAVLKNPQLAAITAQQYRIRKRRWIFDGGALPILGYRLLTGEEIIATCQMQKINPKTLEWEAVFSFHDRPHGVRLTNETPEIEGYTVVGYAIPKAKYKPEKMEIFHRSRHGRNVAR